MAGMLDYSALFNVPGPGPQERGLSAIGDAISGVQQRKQRREELAAQLAAQRQQALMVDNRTREIAANNEAGERRRAIMLDSRDRDKLAQENRFKLHEAVNKDVMPHLVAGHPDLANAVGAPLGIHATEQKAPPVGPAPVNPHPERFAPDLISMALAPNAQNMAHVKQMGDESNKFAADTTKNLAEQQAQDKALANPTYSIDGPGGFSQTYRSAEPREAAARAGGDVATGLTGAAMDEYDKYAAKAVGEMVRTGAIKQEDAGKQASHMAETLRSQDIARIRANRPEHDYIKPDQAVDNARQAGIEARNVLRDMLHSADYTHHLNQYRASQAMLQGLQSNNAAEQRASLGIWAKEKSGPGAVQQTERNEFVNVIGGKDLQLRKKLNEWVNGGLVPDDQLSIFADAVKRYEIVRQQKLLNGIKSRVRRSFENHPFTPIRAYTKWAEDQVDSGFTPEDDHAAEDDVFIQGGK